jgi:hypothetical protein
MTLDEMAYNFKRAWAPGEMARRVEFVQQLRILLDAAAKLHASTAYTELLAERRSKRAELRALERDPRYAKLVAVCQAVGRKYRRELTKEL